MIIYNENKELILKDNFREFHLVNSGFGFIQKTQLRILKNCFQVLKKAKTIRKI